jgi:uncharacterized membrane protein
MRFESWVLDGILFVFFLLILREARISIGREKASIFLWGSLLWTGIIENLMVIMGAYDYFAYADYYAFGGKLINGYSGWISWVLFVPLCISLGWFLLSFPALIISIRVLGEKTGIWVKAALAGAFLVSFDMLMDPISVVNEWWRWTSPGYYLRGVTVGNYIGWFFLLFFFGAVFERTVLQRKGFRGLCKIENLIFKTNTLDLTETGMRTVARIFYFRLMVFLPVFFFVCIAVSSIVSTKFGNNFGPFDSVFPRIGASG